MSKLTAARVNSDWSLDRMNTFRIVVTSLLAREGVWTQFTARALCNVVRARESWYRAFRVDHDNHFQIHVWSLSSLCCSWPVLHAQLTWYFGFTLRAW